MELIVGLFLIPVGLILLYFGFKDTNKKSDMVWLARNGVDLIIFSVGVFIGGLILIYNYFN